MIWASESLRPLTIAVAGQGAAADAWARALRGIEGVEIARTDGASDDDLLALLSRPEIDSVAFATPGADLPHTIKRTLLARRHALIAGPVALASSELRSLDALARRRGRVLLFEAAGIPDERGAFVRKMTAGANAIWRPLYIRCIRTVTGGDHSLDEIAVREIARLMSITSREIEQVSAIAAQDEAGAAGAAFIALVCDDGMTARIDVSTLEPAARHETVIACEGRTLILDEHNPMAPLQILAAVQHRRQQPAGTWGETVNEHPIGTMRDAQSRAASAFVAAVRANDLVASNAAALGRASAIWEACRESISRAGAWTEAAAADRATAARPALQLIHGGGGTTEAGRSAARLRVVGRRDSAPIDLPPASA